MLELDLWLLILINRILLMLQFNSGSEQLPLGVKIFFHNSCLDRKVYLVMNLDYLNCQRWTSAMVIYRFAFRPQLFFEHLLIRKNKTKQRILN